MDLTGKHVAILGVGRSGRAAAALALRHGACVSAWDQAGPDAFRGMPEEVLCHPSSNPESARSCECDMLVVSPGIDTYGPLVTAFSAQAGEVIGEIELAYRYYDGRIIAITGTNGKTTTTALVSRMLDEAGLGGTPCGNFGTPFAEVVMQPSPPATVALEVSSFQLETVSRFKADVAVWLNFAPDHMDRYPTVDAYRSAKRRIFRHLTKDDVVVMRHGEDMPMPDTKLVYFSTTEPASDWFYDGRAIHRQGEAVIELERETSLRGLHNAENAMAAMAACEVLGVSLSVLLSALRECVPPLHRCELVRTLDGVEYLNDSKSTNLHALESALRSQSRPVVLIAGGKEKGLDYSGVVPLLREKAIAAITFGQIAGPLADLFSQAIPCDCVSSLADAVPLARSRAPRGSVVLMSPGTSSFDQFTGYEQRGDLFRDLVHALH